MRILADENMPYASQLFSRFGEVVTMPGREITAAALKGVDILLVRSITRVNEVLLAEADSLRFVGSATIGTDHLDIELLEQRGIHWTNAPGCNATAVAEYVISAMLVQAQRQQFSLKNKRLAIVGAGNIGSRLYDKARALGMDCVLCDPPLQTQGDPRAFVDWPSVAEADIISLHVPITREGPHATENMVDAQWLSTLKPGAMLINSCRGDVVDNQALLNLLQSQKRQGFPGLQVVMDVWQHEPEILLPLLDEVALATPHIAGYSLEGKARGTLMLYQAWCQMNSIAADAELASLLPAPAIAAAHLNGQLDEELIRSLVLGIYDIRRDDATMRQRGITGAGFDGLRKNYWRRREFSSLTLHGLAPQASNTINELGFTRG